MTAGETDTTCDATRTFIPYASTTFTSDTDNGKYICYKAIDSLDNTRYVLSNGIEGIMDIVAPIITINNPNTTTKATKTITASTNE